MRRYEWPTRKTNKLPVEHFATTTFKTTYYAPPVPHEGAYVVVLFSYLVEVPFPPLLSRANPTPISSKTVRFTLPEDNEDESHLKADEAGASEKDTRAATLVGSQFLDDEMSWCTISAWGTNHGSHVLFYSPTVTNPKFPDVEHSSLTEVEAWMLRSPSPPDPAPPPLSRQIRRSPRLALSTVVRWCASPTLPAPGQLQQYGQYYRGAFRAPRLDNRTKLSKSKVRKILEGYGDDLSSMGSVSQKGTAMLAPLPDAVRWKAGRDLEWMRLKAMGTFDGSWTWTRVQREFPKFTKGRFGHLFYVYDYKYLRGAEGPLRLRRE